MEAILENIINVTLLEPKLKHPTIFKGFDELMEGETLIIHNDHNPKPLYYQLLAERGNIFTWDYLEEGPVWWKVKIRKNIIGENDEKLGEIVAKDLRKAEVFKKYGLDFSCEGKQTLKEACAENGLDANKIEQELQQADKVPTSYAMPYDEWKLDFFADYISNTHHYFIKKNLPEITTYSQKVMEVHNHPELITINTLVKGLNSLLFAHIKDEDNQLFPKIKNLVNGSFKKTEFINIKNNINLAEIDNKLISKTLEKIRKLSNNYTLPKDACVSYTLLYRMLEELEGDTLLHLHLENNLLFPKALKLIS